MHINSEGTEVHQLGCSTMRSGKCTCEFLSQWDSKPALPEAAKIGQEFGPNPSQYGSLSTETKTDHPRYEYTAQYVGELRIALAGARSEVRYWKRYALGMGVVAVLVMAVDIARSWWGF